MKKSDKTQPAYRIVPTNRYKRDLRRLKKSGADLVKLEKVIDTLARNESLPKRCKDHELKGALKGIRECHIAPDWLLMYQKENGKCILMLIRTGSHRDVLNRE